MKQLEKYCSVICRINGLMTYIIPSEYYDAILEDAAILKDLNMKKTVLDQYIRIVEEIGSARIFMAVVCHESWSERFQWEPVLCFKGREGFCHIYYHGGWICRECGCDNGAVIMPMGEADPVFYERTNKGYYEFPSEFRKISFKNCGRVLQNHLIQV